MRKCLITLPWIAVTVFFAYYAFVQPLLTPFSTGLDGLDYSDLAIHLTHHIGSFWSPSFTATRYIHFYEHPPVGIWYFALFYKLFGDSWHTDKIIAAFNVLWLLTILLLFFKRDFPKTTLWLFWLPILLLTTIPDIFLYAMTNRFECIDMPLALTVLYWLSQCRYKVHNLKYLSIQSIIIGFICLIGFEINGLLFLYLWGGYMICALTSPNINIKRALYLTVILIASSILFFCLLMWLVPAARHNNYMYFSTQLFPALFGLRTDDSTLTHGFLRINLIGQYFRVTAPWLFISLIGWGLLEARVLFYKIKVDFTCHSRLGTKDFFFYLLLLIATTLPLIASSKVYGYYFLQTNPFMVLLVCIMITPVLQSFYTGIKATSHVVLSWLLAPCFAFLLYYPTFKTAQPLQRYSLDRIGFADAQILARYIPKNSIVSMPTTIFPHGITFIEPSLNRFYNISLIANSGCEYYINSIYNFLPPPKDYHKINTPLILLTLYKREHSLPTCRPQPEKLSEYYSYGYPLILLT